MSDRGGAIHVLIVDDDAGSRLLMRRALERSGFTISEAADGTALRLDRLLPEAAITRQ